MSILWYFLMALGFLIMVMLSVPSEDPPPQPAPTEQEAGPPVP